jgi:aminoglycoside 3-N-acetyltransferase
MNTEIRNVIEYCNINPGDDLMIHSSYSSIKHLFESPANFLDEMIKYLGNDGTLLIPAFNFNSWTQSHYFDISETPSEMGILTEVSRHRKNGIRTIHPIYSFVVFGKGKVDYLNCKDTEAFGDDSVFSVFHKRNGKILSFGLDFNNTFSFTHYVELKHNATYRRIKSFSGIYIDITGIPALKTFSMYVRATLNHQTHINPALEKLKDLKIITEHIVGTTKIHSVNAADYFNELGKIVQTNPELLYKLKN